MLAIISDLHLTDGTSGASIPPGAFQIFAERLQDLALRASWRAGGHYRPIEVIDLVLLGDVLDVIRSSTWLEGTVVRPWSDPHSPELFDLVSRITMDILATNDTGLEVLRALSEGMIRIPPALRSGQPAARAEGVPVPVRIHYMVGNHDWFFHLPGERYDALRRTIRERLGLTTQGDGPFAHDPAENEILLEAQRRHRLLARHGDIYDPFNFEQERDASSLGDVIVIELVNRFAREVERQLEADLPTAVVMGLKEIDNIRPLLLIPVWIDGLLERACPLPVTRKRVKQIWDRMVDDFVALDFMRQRDTWSPLDLVDGLERALKFSRNLSLGWASTVTNWLQTLRGQREESYYQHALGEQDFRNRRAKHIIYGHTHYPELIPLDASYAEAYVHNQVYLNSGTWRRLHRQTMFAPNEHEFIASDTMTYLAFFQGDERGGRPYETWSGTLGVNFPDCSTLRVDSAHTAPLATRHAAAKSISAPAISSRAPAASARMDRPIAFPLRRN